MHLASLYLLIATPVALMITLNQTQCNTHMLTGRAAVVQLFEWPHSSVGVECSRVLAPAGYGAVQISPPQESIASPATSASLPWWQRYQPVSYRLFGRSGSRLQLATAVARCNAAGVRVYVDVVLNHMTGGQTGRGDAGTSYNGSAEQYDGWPAYRRQHFNDANCHSVDGNIDTYQDVDQVRFCRLEGLRDLNQRHAQVRRFMRTYLRGLLRLGVAGFRIDAAKHMWPQDLATLLAGLRVSRAGRHRFHQTAAAVAAARDWRPFVVQEVIDHGGEPVKATQYTGNGRVTEFRHCDHINSLFRRRDRLVYTRTWGPSWGMLESRDALVFVANHDNQRDPGNTVITHRMPRAYHMAHAFMLARPYAVARVMSSYRFSSHDQGPPADARGRIIAPDLDKDGSCGNAGWICEHRWPAIAAMVRFRAVAGNSSLQRWWSNGDQQIAFARGARAFFVLNNQQSGWLQQTLVTGLTPGIYCDVISGRWDNVSRRCSGVTVLVDAKSRAFFNISAQQPNPMVAIHVQEKVHSQMEPIHQPIGGNKNIKNDDVKKKKNALNFLTDKNAKKQTSKRFQPNLNISINSRTHKIRQYYYRT